MIEYPSSAEPAAPAFLTPRGATALIIDRVAREHRMTAAEMIGPSKKRAAIKARDVALAAILDVNTKMSTTQLGQVLGGRDHTTILHALKRIGRRANLKKGGGAR